MKRKKDGFERREELAVFGYWEDPHWSEVAKLRKEGKYTQANTLCGQIRQDWGAD